jgi:hypothetical protein
MSPKCWSNSKGYFFLLSSRTCSEIWLSPLPLVDDDQTTNFTNLKKENSKKETLSGSILKFHEKIT